MARFNIDTMDDLLDECIESVRSRTPDYDKLHEKNIIISNGIKLIALRAMLEKKAALPVKPEKKLMEFKKEA